MTTFDPQAYGRVFAMLLATNRCRPLGPGQAVDAMRAPLKNLTIQTAFGDDAIVDADMARCCIAAVWLLYDYLDESHTISQGIATPEGSYWHGIMHRREGDFSNAKYWFRRVGTHPIFTPVAARAKAIAEEDPQTDDFDRLVAGPSWDPIAFVDLCQRVQQGLPDVRQECELLQQVEWELLFDHCYRSTLAS